MFPRHLVAFPITWCNFRPFLTIPSGQAACLAKIFARYNFVAYLSEPSPRHLAEIWPIPDPLMHTCTWSFYGQCGGNPGRHELRRSSLIPSTLTWAIQYISGRASYGCTSRPPCVHRPHLFIRLLIFRLLPEMSLITTTRIPRPLPVASSIFPADQQLDIEMNVER